MVAELRKIGSQVVLFTNEAPIYRRLNGLSLTKYKVPYLQNGKLVGIDFYFDKKLRNTIQRVKGGQLFLGI
jgi:hypothetical protein